MSQPDNLFPPRIHKLGKSYRTAPDYRETQCESSYDQRPNPNRIRGVPAPDRCANCPKCGKRKLEAAEKNGLASRVYPDSSRRTQGNSDATQPPDRLVGGSSKTHNIYPNHHHHHHHHHHRHKREPSITVIHEVNPSYESHHIHRKCGKTIRCAEGCQCPLCSARHEHMRHSGANDVCRKLDKVYQEPAAPKCLFRPPEIHKLPKCTDLGSGKRRRSESRSPSRRFSPAPSHSSRRGRRSRSRSVSPHRATSAGKATPTGNNTSCHPVAPASPDLQKTQYAELGRRMWQTLFEATEPTHTGPIDHVPSLPPEQRAAPRSSFAGAHRSNRERTRSYSPLHDPPPDFCRTSQRRQSSICSHLCASGKYIKMKFGRYFKKVEVPPPPPEVNDDEVQVLVRYGKAVVWRKYKVFDHE